MTGDTADTAATAAPDTDATAAPAAGGVDTPTVVMDPHPGIVIGTDISLLFPEDPKDTEAPVAVVTESTDPVVSDPIQIQ